MPRHSDSLIIRIKRAIGFSELVSIQMDGDDIALYCKLCCIKFTVHEKHVRQQFSTHVSSQGHQERLLAKDLKKKPAPRTLKKPNSPPKYQLSQHQLYDHLSANHLYYAVPYAPRNVEQMIRENYITDPVALRALMASKNPNCLGLPESERRKLKAMKNYSESCRFLPHAPATACHGHVHDINRCLPPTLINCPVGITTGTER